MVIIILPWLYVMHVYLLLFTRAHFVIGPWAVEMAHK
jgi:hypothetical protein